MILHPSSAAIPLSLISFSARRKKCGFTTHVDQNRLLLFFLFSQKQPVRDTLGDMWSPETQGFSQTQLPQCPDSATTTTGSCSDSVFSEKLLAVIYSNDYISSTLGSQVSLLIFKGGTTFQSFHSYSTCTSSTMTYKQHIQQMCALILPKFCWVLSR